MDAIDITALLLPTPGTTKARLTVGMVPIKKVKQLIKEGYQVSAGSPSSKPVIEQLLKEVENDRPAGTFD